MNGKSSIQRIREIKQTSFICDSWYSFARAIRMVPDRCSCKEVSAKRRTCLFPRLSRSVVPTSSVSNLRCSLLNLFEYNTTVTLNTFQTRFSFFSNDNIFQNQPRYPYEAFFKGPANLGFNLLTAFCLRLTLEADKSHYRGFLHLLFVYVFRHGCSRHMSVSRFLAVLVDDFQGSLWDV